MQYQNAQLRLDTSQVVPGRIRWRSPSNIALIKYWGKHGVQLPRNPSISFTLNNAATDTLLAYQPRQGADTTSGISLNFLFEGTPNPAFAGRVEHFLQSLLPMFPFLRQLDLSIETSNSFPHSAGIASSASAMSALALCLCSLEHELFETLDDDEAFEQKASYVARLGSGSACRSIYPFAAVWGETGEVEGSSDEYAVPYVYGLQQPFLSFHDDILLISRSEKAVSSRAGHEMMEDNPYAGNRYQQARQRLHSLLYALRTGDLELFGQIVEAEALTLHALMMTSSPAYLLLEPNTLAAIQKVYAFRRDTRLPLYFTLDAGPNLHLLYPEEAAATVREYIRAELLPLCTDELYIADQVGEGPVELDPEFVADAAGPEQAEQI